MPTLILPPRYSSDSIAMRKAALEAGWQVERLHNWRAPQSLCDREIALYGEPIFVAAIAEQLDIALIEPHFSWLADIPDKYSRRKVRYDVLENLYNISEPMFIKPADDKCFPAAVYSSGLQFPITDVLPGDTPVLISDPVQWEIEFRCFVLNRTIKAISPYFRGGELAQVPDGQWPVAKDELSLAHEFASSILNDTSISFPPGVVLDIGKIAKNGWAVVELNPAWGSGIYGCSPIEVLPVIARTCVHNVDVAEMDRMWILQR